MEGFVPLTRIRSGKTAYFNSTRISAISPAADGTIIFVDGIQFVVVEDIVEIITKIREHSIEKK